MNLSVKRRALMALPVCALVFLRPASAQEASQNNASTADALETITVTAQKRSENIKDVPISISVIGRRSGPRV